MKKPTNKTQQEDILTTIRNNMTIHDIPEWFKELHDDGKTETELLEEYRHMITYDDIPNDVWGAYIEESKKERGI